MTDRRPVCYYSVVRYVPDPIRNEPRNIGTLVVCDDRSYAKGRFSFSRAGLPARSERYAFLRTIIGDLQLGNESQLNFLTSLRPGMGVEELQRLCEESTNAVQFTPPLPAPGEPDRVLDDVYRDFVAPRSSGGSSTWSRANAESIFRRSFRQVGMENWVQSVPRIEVPGEPPYVFDLGIKNGKWIAVIDTLSFKGEDPQRPEERAAWMAAAWPQVRREVPGRALLFVQTTPAAQGRVARINGWLRPAGVEVYEAGQARMVASELANQLTH